ncbi:unnamed protein product [Prorocentrum cordatum]|uniref:Activator of Hsp90 ATPase AHSA1-like N-terminal domain-containing protein n=1 Tax=Prorocentrum cordatum TaxID=2364126 RepID=A0ABN9WFE2_9DINO|nr:unnamed protein product [Polarella glacialis]
MSGTDAVLSLLGRCAAAGLAAGHWLHFWLLGLAVVGGAGRDLRAAAQGAARAASLPACAPGALAALAGTYEEKSMTKWVQDQLKSKLAGVAFEIPAGAGGGSISCSSVDDIKGDANISVCRGKRRHLMDMSFDVEYEGKVGDSGGKGRLSFTEVNCDDECEVEMKMNSDVPPAVREVFNAFVKPAGQGLQPLLLKEIKAIIEEYKGK